MTPTEKLSVRAAVANYLVRCENNRANIHYTQQRPYTLLGDRPEGGFYGDCSSYVTAALFWAQKTLGIPVRDPNNRNYDGYGYTGTLLSVNRGNNVPSQNLCLVGDMGLYGPASSTRHVVICRSKGYRNSAVWSSFGSEAGPLPVRLNYRSDLLGVYRPWALL